MDGCKAWGAPSYFGTDCFGVGAILPPGNAGLGAVISRTCCRGISCPETEPLGAWPLLSSVNASSGSELKCCQAPVTTRGKSKWMHLPQ
jgi:hypothetical protein